MFFEDNHIYTMQTSEIVSLNGEQLWCLETQDVTVPDPYYLSKFNICVDQVTIPCLKKKQLSEKALEAEVLENSSFIRTCLYITTYGKYALSGVTASF